MSIGIEEAARRAGRRLSVMLAVEADREIADIYRRNIDHARLRVMDVGQLFDGELGTKLTASEREVLADVGPLSILLGGPPCQGHSDLNNHTRHQTPDQVPGYWDNALKNGAEIGKISSLALQLIRERARQWEKFDPGP